MTFHYDIVSKFAVISGTISTFVFDKFGLDLYFLEANVNPEVLNFWLEAQKAAIGASVGAVVGMIWWVAGVWLKPRIKRTLGVIEEDK